MMRVCQRQRRHLWESIREWLLVPPFTRAFLKSPSSRGLSAIAELLVCLGCLTVCLCVFIVLYVHFLPSSVFFMSNVCIVWLLYVGLVAWNKTMEWNGMGYIFRQTFQTKTCAEALIWTGETAALWRKIFELEIAVCRLEGCHSRLQHNVGGRVFNSELSVLVECCRSQWGQPARWSLRQRPATARLHEATHRWAGTQRSQTVRHLQNATGLWPSHEVENRSLFGSL